MKLRAYAELQNEGNYSIWITKVSVMEPRQTQGQSKEYCELLARGINQVLKLAGLLDKDTP